VKPQRTHRRAAAVLAAGVLVLGLAACAGGPGQGVVSAASTKDRVTASDEPDGTKRARFRLELAAAYFGRGQLETALDELKQSIAADPNQAPAFNLRGLIYASLGDSRLADESFRRALQLNPRDTDAMQNFAWHLCQEKRYGEADAMFAQLLAQPQYSGTSRTLLSQGVCQARAGQLPAAERSLSRSFEVDPQNPSTAANLADVLFRRGDLERARYYIRRVNAASEYVSAQTLWLAARIENKLGNQTGVDEIAARLRSRFPQSREATAVEQGRFDE